MMPKNVEKKSNKRIKLFGMFLYLFLRIVFLAGVVIGLVGGYHDDIMLMKIGLYPIVVCGVIMGILHVLCFKFFGEFLGFGAKTKR